MNKQQIEEAAAKAAEDYMENTLIMSGPRGSYRKGFIAGANWRINSVWHEVSERPDENEPTIIERENGKFSLHEKGYDGPWKYNVEQFNFKRWAYVKDLIPETED